MKKAMKLNREFNQTLPNQRAAMVREVLSGGGETIERYNFQHLSVLFFLRENDSSRSQ